ncbi:MAG: DUF294 nucleotidyltransferase-like domain-containing protein [Candidatus Methylophosphatis roskildensis]
MIEQGLSEWDAQDDNNMQSELGSVVRRSPATIPLDASIRAALEVMDRHQSRAIVVIDPETERPRGVFTLPDLVRRVVLKELDINQPIADVMTRNLVTMRPHQTAHQAAVLMAQRNIRHVMVTDLQGHLVGIVSQNDLYSLQRSGVRELSAEIARAADIGALKLASDSIDRLAHSMLNKGVGAEALTHFISTLNDLLTLRVIELTEAEFELPDVPWCWIALGSEGRYEQTLYTDQDNGIIFDVPAGTDAASLREAFLPFAQAVNNKLDACGFMLCKGNIMASNPQWCLSLTEWKNCFADWMEESRPQALLNASIFFDFRPLHGDETLAESLRTWLNGRAPENTVFLRLMAKNAVDCQPPIGLIREFVFDGNKSFPHTIDLKKSGTRLFVDAARIFSLAHGIGYTSTAQRLRAASNKLSLGKDDINAVIEGFYFIQTLRLRHQHRSDLADDAANRIDPDSLNQLERHILREAFKQAKRLQQRLALDYQL